MKKLTLLIALSLLMSVCGCQKTEAPTEIKACKTWPQPDCYIDSTNVDTIILNAPINQKNDQDRTPLMVARDAESVRALISSKADVNARTRDGRSALFFSNPKTIGLLINAHADLNFKTTADATLLMIASANEDLQLVKTLVEAGADLNAKDYNGRTALHYAASIHQVIVNGDERKVITNVLDLSESNPHSVHTKDHVVDPNNAYGADIIYKTSDPAIAKTLIEAGADVNAKDVNGRTPLFFALNRDIAESLIAANANVNIQDNQGMTPLQAIQTSQYKPANGLNDLVTVLTTASAK